MEVITRSMRVRASQHTEWTASAIESAVFRLGVGVDRPASLWILDAAGRSRDSVSLAVQSRDSAIGPFIGIHGDRLIVGADEEVGCFDVVERREVWRIDRYVALFGLQLIGDDLLVVDEIAIERIGSAGETQWQMPTDEVVREYAILPDDTWLAVHLFDGRSLKINLGTGAVANDSQRIHR
jgi:hypothetical protein